MAPGPFATKGFTATSDGRELPGYIDILRNQEKVDLVFLASEFGLAKNVYFGPNGEVLDATEVVVNYSNTTVADPDMDRIKLLYPLPRPAFRSPERQPLKGIPVAH